MKKIIVSIMPFLLLLTACTVSNFNSGKKVSKTTHRTQQVTSEFSKTAQSSETVKSTTATTIASSSSSHTSSNAKTYTIRWVNWNNEVLEIDYNVPHGSTPSYDGLTPTRESNNQYKAYIFTGWEPSITTVTKDATYKAKFDGVLNTFTVTWLNWDNTVLEIDYDVPYGSAPSYDSNTPSKESDLDNSYTFSGWSLDIAEITSDTTFKAQFDATPFIYVESFSFKQETLFIDTKTNSLNCMDFITYLPKTANKVDFEFVSSSSSVAEIIDGIITVNNGGIFTISCNYTNRSGEILTQTMKCHADRNETNVYKYSSSSNVYGCCDENSTITSNASVNGVLKATFYFYNLKCTGVFNESTNKYYLRYSYKLKLTYINNTSALRYASMNLATVRVDGTTVTRLKTASVKTSSIAYGEVSSEYYDMEVSSTTYHESLGIAVIGFNAVNFTN